MWWDVLRTGFILTLPGASQWRLQISACSAIGCLSVTSAMEISTLLTQLPVSSLEPYLILAVTRLKSMDSGRCRLAEAIPTQGRRTSCSLRLARTMNRMGCWASLVQSPPNSAETPNKPLLQVAKPARWLSANERPLLGYIDANGFVFAPNFLRPLNSFFLQQRVLPHHKGVIYLFAALHLAHRAFVAALIFANPAAEICRLPALIGTILWPFAFAQRAFCAAEIFARAAAFILRGPCDPPLRSVPLSAEIAVSSACNCPLIFARSAFN